MLGAVPILNVLQPTMSVANPPTRGAYTTSTATLRNGVLMEGGLPHGARSPVLLATEIADIVVVVGPKLCLLVTMLVLETVVQVIVLIHIRSTTPVGMVSVWPRW